MNRVFLSIGTNLGNRKENILNAQDLITERLGDIVQISPIYENPPLGFEAPLSFYNLCIELVTELDSFDLLMQIQEIEVLIGRKVKSDNGFYSSRIIDIDIIFVNDLIIEAIDLNIPHKLFKERKFVLKPLSDIALEYIDPISKQSVRSLLNNCKDHSDLVLVF